MLSETTSTKEGAFAKETIKGSWILVCKRTIKNIRGSNLRSGHKSCSSSKGSSSNNGSNNRLCYENISISKATIVSSSGGAVAIVGSK